MNYDVGKISGPNNSVARGLAVCMYFVGIGTYTHSLYHTLRKGYMHVIVITWTLICAIYYNNDSVFNTTATKEMNNAIGLEFFFIIERE